MRNVEQNVGLDYEWVELMKEAKTIGLTTEEVRLFLTGSQEKE